MKKTLFAMLLLITIALSVTIVACSNEVKKVAVTGVTLNKEKTTITATDNEKLVATIEPANASNKKVTWSSSNTDVATVDANGLVTAITSGTSVITVKTEDGGFEDSCTVTVVPAPIPVDSVTVSPATLNLTVGSKGQLTATISPTDASVQTITWSSNNESVATVSNSGEVTAIAAGNATITAKAGGETDSCAVSVSAENYITFSSTSPFTLTIPCVFDGTLEYSTNTNNWIKVTTSYIGHEEIYGNPTSCTDLTATDCKLYFKGNNKTITGESGGHSWIINAEGKVSLSGNIMTLLNCNSPATVMTDDNGYCFSYMFECGSNLTNVSGLTLPATVLADDCYSGMFKDCTSLTDIPDKLPATILADYCYDSMFKNCTSIEKAPELPAENLGDYCYKEMFNYCTSLTDVPSLPALELTGGCYLSMFEGCTGLTTISATLLPATKLATDCYCGMFSGCSGLTNCPYLSSTDLAEGCYYDMFNGCTSLRETPELPATEMIGDCYYGMFKGCSKLEKINPINVTKLSEKQYDQDYFGCFGKMFENCNQLCVTMNSDYPAEQKGEIFTCPSTEDLNEPVDDMFNEIAYDSEFSGTPESDNTYYWYIPDPE